MHPTVTDAYRKCVIRLSRQFAFYISTVFVTVVSVLSLVWVTILTLASLDLSPDTIFVKIKGIDSMEEKDLMNLLGEPERQYFSRDFRDSGNSEPGDSDSADVNNSIVTTKYTGIRGHECILDEIAVGGFEESFLTSQPPLTLPTTWQLASPEVLCAGVPGPAKDIWTLACTIWTMRTGFPPFTWKYFDFLRHAIGDIEYFLGPLPEPYKTAIEKCEAAQYRGILKIKNDLRVILYVDEGNDPGSRAHPYQFDPQRSPSPQHPEREEFRNIPDAERVKLNEDYEIDIRSSERNPNLPIDPLVRRSVACDCCEPDINREDHPYCTSGLNERVPGSQTPFERELAKNWKGIRRDPTPDDPTYDRKHPNWKVFTWRIPNNEIVPLADLISKALKYDPKDRIDAGALLRHPWFQLLSEKSLSDRNEGPAGASETIGEHWRNRLRPRKKQRVN